MHSRITLFQPGTATVIAHYQTGVFSSGYQNLVTHAGTGSHTAVDLRVEFPHGGATCNFSNVSVDKDVVVFPTCDIEDYTPGSAIPLTASPVASAVNTALTLTADAGITPTSTELVTFALPFAEGDVTNINEIKVSIGGSEVAAFVEADLTYHWSDNSFRS